MINLKRNIALVLLSLLFNNAYAQEEKTLMLKLEVSDSAYNLLDAWVLSRSFPASQSEKRASEGALNWDITSATGEVLAKGIIPDPQVIRAHLADADKLSFEQSRLKKTTVIIRVPYNKNMQKLNIERTPIIYLPSVQEKAAKKSQKLDVNKHGFLITPREVK
jgi:hypothetical protein